MNTILRITAILIISIIGNYLQAQTNNWEIINPVPTYQDGKDIYFLDDNIGFILTSTTLLKTTDGGDNWQKHLDITPSNRMVFKNSVAYIIGNNGIVYQSKDKGEHWNTVDANFTEHLKAITLVAEDTVRITSANKLFLSDDGGKNWEIRDITAQLSRNNTIEVNDCFFTDGNTGHVVCERGLILKTKDGGKTWIAKHELYESSSRFHRINFTTKDIGFASREFTSLFKTTDGGETWSSTDCGVSVKTMHFINKDTGYIAGDDGYISKTMDGGASWHWINPQNMSGPKDFYGMYFINGEKGFVTGRSGRIIHTTDGGESWQENSITHRDIRQISVASGTSFYFTATAERNLYKFDNDKNYITIKRAIQKDTYPVSIDFVNDQTGYGLCGPQYNSNINTLYKTTNGGDDWTVISDDPDLNNSDLKSVYFINENIGFLKNYAGDKGTLKTTDGGITWEPVSIVRLNKLHFVNANTGFASDDHYEVSKIYKSKDTGSTWQIIFEAEYAIEQFHFQDEYNGWIICKYGIAYKTKDGGKTWQKMTLERLNYISIASYSPNIAFILDSYGKIFRTSNGGESWKLWDRFGSATQLTIQKNSIIVSGKNGLIVKHTVPIDPFSIAALPPDSIMSRNAIFKGAVASNAQPITNYTIEYSEDKSFTHKISFPNNPVSANSSLALSKKVTGLKPKTKYYYRLSAVYNAETHYSDTIEFSTLDDIRLYIDRIYNNTPNEAQLYGSVFTRVSNVTDIEIQYGENEAFDHIVSINQGPITEPKIITFDHLFKNLKANTDYAFRLKGTYNGVDYFSNVTKLTTPPNYIIHYSGHTIDGNDVNVEGFIRAYKGSLVDIILEYGTNRIYDKSVEITPNLIEVGSTVKFSAVLPDLDPDKTYFYRVKALQDKVPIYGDESILSMDNEIVLIPLEVKATSENTAIAQFLVTPSQQAVHRMRVKYGINETITDSVYTTPYYISGQKTFKLQAVMTGLEPGSEYTIQLSCDHGTEMVSTEKFTYTHTYSGTTGIDDLEPIRDLVVFPNPAQDFIYVESSVEITKIELINSHGRILKVQNKKEMDISAFPPGLYFVRIFSDEKFVTRKIIHK